MENNTLAIGEKAKKRNWFVRFMRMLFVNNIGYKILSVALSALLWALATGLAI